MKEFNCKQTVQNIKNIVIDVLERCGLHIDNVYSCTTNNGANMLKASELFAKAQQFDNLENGFDELVSVIEHCVSHTIQLVAFNVTKIHKNTSKRSESL